jgi:hypothetical protein
MHILNTLPQRLDSGATPTFTGLLAPSLTAPTDLTLAGGSTGASLVLGQGATAASVTASPKGTGSFDVSASSSSVLAARVINTNTADSAARLQIIRSTTGTARTWTFGVGELSTADLDIVDSTASAIRARLTTTGNLLIGGTTDITGSGGLKVFGTTAAFSTTSGALQVAGGVGVAGAGYFGGVLNVAGDASFSSGTFAMTGGAGSYGLTISNTSATTRLTTSFGGSSLGFRVNAAGADQLTVSGSAVNIPLTTSASSSTVGALTIGNGTAATNVAIGGGNVNAGGTGTFGGAVNTGLLTITNTGSNALIVNTTAGNSLAVFNASSGAADANAYFAVQTSGANRWYFGQSISALSGDFEIYSVPLGASALKLAKATGAATFAGAVTIPAATTARAPMRIPHGTAPTSPVDGDMWTTTAGLFIRINGATVGPLS